jgi:exonuclease III
MDKEIENFLRNERGIFKNRDQEASPSPNEEKKSKERVEATSINTKQKQLKEKWKEGKKELKIACHNINGLKTKGWKLESLLGWAEEEEITILGIMETNLTESEGKFLMHAANRKYVGFWASAAKDKKKGSGVGILVEEQWEKHVGAVKKINEYMIEIILYFKQLELIILGVYIPPNDKIAGRLIQQKIVEIISKRKRQTQVVIFGDFNHTANNVLDRQHPQPVNFKRLPIFNWIRKQDFCDTYRDMHPMCQKYTWSNEEAATRIDYI